MVTPRTEIPHGLRPDRRASIAAHTPRVEQEVSQRPTFRRAPRGTYRPASRPAPRHASPRRMPDAGEAPRPDAGAYRPAHMAPASARTTAPSAARPVGTRFSPAAVTEPLPRVPGRLVRPAPPRPAPRQDMPRQGASAPSPRPAAPRPSPATYATFRSDRPAAHRPVAPGETAPFDPRIPARRGVGAMLAEQGLLATIGAMPTRLLACGVAAVALVLATLVSSLAGGASELAGGSSSWFAPAPYALAIHGLIALALVLWCGYVASDVFKRGERRMPAAPVSVLVPAAVVLAVMSSVAARLGAVPLHPALLVVLWGVVFALFVFERMTGEALRWAPFSLWAGWLTCLVPATLMRGDGALPPSGWAPIAAGAVLIALVFGAAFLMRRLCDDVAFGIAVAWSAVAVTVGAAATSIPVALFFGVVTLVGVLAALVPWEALAPERAPAHQRIQGGAARTQAARESARVAAARPRTRVTHAAAEPARRREAALKTSSRF